MSAIWRGSALATRRWTTTGTTKAGHGHAPPARLRGAGGGASAVARRSPRSTQRYQDTAATQCVSRWELEVAEGSGEPSSRAAISAAGPYPTVHVGVDLAGGRCHRDSRGPDRVSVRDGLAMRG